MIYLAIFESKSSIHISHYKPDISLFGMNAPLWPFSAGDKPDPASLPCLYEKICMKILLDKKTTTNNMAFHK